MQELKWLAIAVAIFALALLATAAAPASAEERRVMARLATCDTPEQIETLFRAYQETEETTLADAMQKVNEENKPPVCGFGDLLILPADKPIKSFVIGEVEFGIFPLFVIAYAGEMGLMRLQTPMPQFGVRIIGKAQAA